MVSLYLIFRVETIWYLTIWRSQYILPSKLIILWHGCKLNSASRSNQIHLWYITFFLCVKKCLSLHSPMQVEWLHVPQTSLSTADVPLVRASHLTWMSPKQRQNLQQWLGAEPDRAANGDPGKRSRDAEKVYVIIHPLRWSSEEASTILVLHSN